MKILFHFCTLQAGLASFKKRKHSSDYHSKCLESGAAKKSEGGRCDCHRKTRLLSVVSWMGDRSGGGFGDNSTNVEGSPPDMSGLTECSEGPSIVC